MDGRRRPMLIAGVCASMVLGGSVGRAQADSTATHGKSEGRFVAVQLPTSNVVASGPSPRYIVRMRTKQATKDAVAVESANGAKVDTTWSNALNGFVATLSTDSFRRLRRDPNVASIEPDSVVTISTDQSNPPWGLDRIDQSTLPLSNGYSYDTDGAGVTAYIVDSGIRTTHSEFAGRISRGMFVDFGDGIGIEDCVGHGTHVAGTIGGTRYGMAKAVTLVPVKVFACTGSTTTSAIIAGLDWIVADHTPGVPAVANMSLGGSPSDALDAAVNAAIADGVTVVVAAGNSSSDSCDFSPARVPGAITVGASEIDDRVATYSNYGGCNDVFAPGSKILSAWNTGDNAAATLSGTSMATPHVTGAVARLLQTSPIASPAEVWATIAAASTTDVLSGTYGGDPNKLLHVAGHPAPAVPNAPRTLTGVAGSAQVALTWVAPWFDSSLPVTDYVVQYRLAADPWSTFADGVVGAPAATVTGLASNTNYQFRVAAVNAIGIGVLGASISLTTLDSGAPAEPPPTSTQTQFTALAPARLFDTRPGEASGMVSVRKAVYGGGNVLSVKITGAAGVPSSGVSAVSLNVTVVRPVAAGFVTVYPCGDRPLASSVNFAADQTVPNAVVASLSPAGTLCFFSSADAYLVADINGWFASGSGYTALPPVRAFDTRPGEAQGAVTVTQQPYGDLRVKITGVAGVPMSGAGAVSLNVTVVDPVAAGFVTVYPCGDRPVASNLNYTAGQVASNAVIAPLSPDDEVCFFSSTAAHLVADVNGWFATGSAFSVLAPARVFDTRPGQAQGAVNVSQQPYGELRVRIAGATGVPASGVSAVSLNVTVVDPTSAGFVTVYPCGDRPLASNLNFVLGETVPNAVITPLSADGDVCFYSSANANLVVDINGWFEG
jgi:subtilisin family serine protease